ncbi:MAG: molybdenum cofactor guanylyltransferase [Deltaproteobacteria bacterium]|nr:molybdenum cofactor guanylyltransferase [Deltaproteobacteria bacterium]
MVAAAIIAGGQGRRLGGVAKPFLEIGGQRIIDRQLAVLRPLFDAIVIVAPDRQPFADSGIDVEVVPDRQGPGLGPLAGLDAALAWLPSHFQSVVCVAGDMPFLAPKVLEQLRDTKPSDAAAVVPRLGRAPELRPQPLCARYHRRIASLTTKELHAGTRALHVFLEQIARASISPPTVWIDEPELRQLDPTLATFTNINERSDLLLY